MEVFVRVSLLSLVWGHGYINKPPARNSMWRHGYQNPVDFTDNEVFCGGYNILWNWNEGKCGVCGDSVTDPVPRLHETGGKFGNKIITATYEEGDVIDVEIVVNTNHLGFFEIKLCPITGDDEETSECFEEYPLEVVRGPGQRKAEARVLVLSNITCITTGLRRDITDLWCEEICVRDLYNCPPQFCRCTIDVIGDEEPVSSPEVTTNNPPSDDPEDGVMCRGSGGYEDVPSMDVFCTKSCQETVPSFCPDNVCLCSDKSNSSSQERLGRRERRRCTAVGEFSSDPHMGTFCSISCSHPVPHCPPDLCHCNFTPSTPSTTSTQSTTTPGTTARPWWQPSSTSSSVWWRPPTSSPNTASSSTPKWWKFTASTARPQVATSPTLININHIPSSYTVPQGSVLYSIDVAELQKEQFKYRLETSHRRPGRHHYSVLLPRSVRCERCVLQWTWVTGNTWGTCNNGNTGLGCGPQETFRNCADVRIVGKGEARNVTDTGTRKHLYQLNTLGELEPLVVDWAICVATSPDYSDQNCMEDCFRYPPQCDFSKCRCLTRCESVGEFSRLTGSSEWCNMSCLRYPSLCPPEKCSCQ